MEDERDDIVTLIDENGEEVEFEHIDTVEMNGNEYVILAAMEDEESDDQEEVEEVIILKVEHSENGEDTFATIEDEEELDAVFEEFQAHMEEEFGPEE